MASRSLGTLTLDLVARIGGFTQSMNQAAQTVDRRMKSMQESADRAKRALTSVFALTLGGMTVKGLADMADQYGQMADRIKMATSSADEYNQVQQRLLQTANVTYRPLQEAQELYIRTADSIKSLGYNTEQALDITDSFSYLLVTNAASADRASSSISALSKSIQTGKVSADSWQSILAATPTIVDSLAQATDKTTAEIRDLGIQGKLSLNDLLEGLRKNVEENKKLAESMGTTLNDALVRFKNNLTTLVGEQNSAYGATATLAHGITTLGDNLNLLAAGAFVLLSYKAGAMASSLMASSVASVNNTRAAIQNAIAEREAAAAKVQSLTATMRQSQALAAQAQQLTLNARLNEMATRGTIQHAAALNALASARRNEVAANLRAVQATKALNLAQTASTSIARGLLGVLGGPVGIGLTVASVAAGWLMFKDNTNAADEALSKIQGTIEQVTEELNKMSVSQLKATYDAIIDKIDTLKNKQKEVAESAMRSFRSSAQVVDYDGTFLFDDKDIKAAIEYFEELTKKGKSFSEAVVEVQQKFGDIIPKETLRTLMDSAAEYDNLGDKVSDLSNKANLARNNMDGMGQVAQNMIAVFNGLGASMRSALSPEQAKKYESIIGNIQSRILSLQDPSGMLSLKKSLSDINISEGTKEWDDAIAGQEKINALLNQRNQLKSSTKNVDDVAKAYKNQVDQLNQQIALFNETSEAAKMRYELANGEFKALNDIQKQLLINKSIELDQLNARKEFDSLMKELRTDEEKARDTLAERVELLKKANIQGQEYAKAMARISKDTISEAPKFGGIDANVGGASGELLKVAETQRELDKWRAKELEQQQNFLDEKLIAEEDYANNVAEINKRTAQSQEQLNNAWRTATLATFATVTGDAASMLKELAGESSTAYKAMFAVSKAASIAQAIISTEKAAAEALSFDPSGVMSGITRGLGYASVGMIAATSIAGMAHSGIDNIPKEGTWLLDKGERVLSPRQNSDLTKFLNNTKNSGIATANVAPQVNITINQDGSGSVSASDGYENMGRQMFEQIRQIARSTIIQEKNKGGVLDPNNRRTG